MRNTTLLGIGGVLVGDNDGGVQFINSDRARRSRSSRRRSASTATCSPRSTASSRRSSTALSPPSATNQFGVANTKLGISTNNGGPTQTRLPDDDSPAVNTGNAAIEVAAARLRPARPDFPRVQGVALDIGAVEIQVPPLPATGSTIPMWIPIVGGVVLLVGIAAIAFTVVSRRRLHAAEAAASAPKPPSEPSAELGHPADERGHRIRGLGEVLAVGAPTDRLARPEVVIAVLQPVQLDGWREARSPATCSAVPNGSRVPWQMSAGVLRCSRCAVRSCSGRSGGWNG